MIDTITSALSLSIENGDFDEITFAEITLEQKDTIIDSLRFSSERVGIDVEEIPPGKKQ